VQANASMQKETKEPRLVLTGSNNRNYAVDMRSEEQVLHLMLTIVLMWVLENRRNLNILYIQYVHESNVRSSLFILRTSLNSRFVGRVRMIW
jgi:hypothetical protein